MASYFYGAYSREYRKKIIYESLKILKPRSDSFDTIAVRGMSGALIGPTLADLLDKDIILIRKASDGPSHSTDSDYTIHYSGNPGKRYIVVDDFISGGNTVRAVTEAMATTFSSDKCVAIFLYWDTRANTEFEGIPVWRISAKDIGR
jgi:adenine/guanine phosphoribosyltransferase-like PRPP-binding protein